MMSDDLFRHGTLVQCATCTAVHGGPNKSVMKILLLSHVVEEEAILCLRGSNSGLYASKATWAIHKEFKNQAETQIVCTCHQRAREERRNPVAEAPGKAAPGGEMKGSGREAGRGQRQASQSGEGAEESLNPQGALSAEGRTNSR